MKKDDKCPELEDLIKRFAGPVGRLLSVITGEINHRRRSRSMYHHVKRCKRCFTIIPHIWEAIAQSNEVHKAIIVLKYPLSKITPREKKIIKMRFGLADGVTYSLEEIEGLNFSLTRERIRQIEKRTLEKAASELQAVYPTFKLIPVVAAYLDKKKLNPSGELGTPEKVLSYPKSYQQIQLALLKVLRT